MILLSPTVRSAPKSPKNWVIHLMGFRLVAIFMLLAFPASAQTLGDLEARIEVLEAIHGINQPPTASVLVGSCDEGVACGGDIGLSDPVTVIWGSSTLTGFSGQGATWTASPVDGDNGVHEIFLTLDDGTNQVPLTLEITVQDTINPPALPNMVSDTTLAGCVSQLNSQARGWCELGVSFANSGVYPNPAPWGNPRGIVRAWNGWAVDESAGKIWMIGNGGHADYGGNGAYEFDLATGAWSRIKDPCPLTFTLTEGQEPYGTFTPNTPGDTQLIPEPSCGPSSSHTYDSVQFSKKTGTIFWVSGIYGVPQGTFVSDNELWEFNPSGVVRNGLTPLTWRMHDVKILNQYLSSVELPNGDILYGSNHWSANGSVRFDPSDPVNTITSGGGLDNYYSDMNGILSPDSTEVYVISHRSHGLMKAPVASGTGVLISGNIGFQNGGDFAGDLLVMWDGLNLIHEYSLSTGEFVVTDWSGLKPSEGQVTVYSKWTYLQSHGVFVGLSDERTGVLVYKH